MSAVSVVVADAATGRAPDPAVLEALASQTSDADEIVWVDGVGRDPAALGRVALVRAPHDSSRGDLYALGLERARHPVVALTDSTTRLEPGWRDALERSIADGATVVGGPVLPSPGRSARGDAGFLVEYGPHAVPPYTSATGDVSGNNVAYRREALASTPAGAVWKFAVNARLKRSGVTPVLAEDMRVTVLKDYRWSDLVRGRFRHGRQYGGHRAAGWTPVRRALAAVGCGALPALALARLARAVGPDRTLRHTLAMSAPLVLLALLSWSFGEAMGYLFGTGDVHGLV